MFPSSKEVFRHNFRQFLENWNFEGNSTGADLSKIENLVILNCAKKIGLFVPLIKRSVFHVRQENWIFDGNSTPYKNSENLVLS